MPGTGADHTDRTCGDIGHDCLDIIDQAHHGLITKDEMVAKLEHILDCKFATEAT